MACALRMSRGMAVERIVTATDVTAHEADAQVQPFVAGLLAIFATDGACRYVAGFIEVVTIVVHAVQVLSASQKRIGIVITHLTTR